METAAGGRGSVSPIGRTSPARHPKSGLARARSPPRRDSCLSPGDPGAGRAVAERTRGQVQAQLPHCGKALVGSIPASGGRPTSARTARLTSIMRASMVPGLSHATVAIELQSWVGHPGRATPLSPFKAGNANSVVHGRASVRRRRRRRVADAAERKAGPRATAAGDGAGVAAAASAGMILVPHPVLPIGQGYQAGSDLVTPGIPGPLRARLHAGTLKPKMEAQRATVSGYRGAVFRLLKACNHRKSMKSPVS